MKKRTYLGMGSIGAAFLLLFSTTPAHANWESWIAGGRVGFTSHEWKDKEYSEIKFRGCGGNDRPLYSLDVQLEYKLFLWKKVGKTKHFTACTSGGTSIGTWHNLLPGTYRFKIAKMNGGNSGSFGVAVVRQDTTKAD